MALSNVGRIKHALALGEKLEPEMNADQLTSWVNVLICAGQYQRAITVGETYPVNDWSDVSDWTLNQTNLAEADYNQGRWFDALERLDRIAVPLRHANGLTNTGAALQRAWILAALNEPERARASFEATEPLALISTQFMSEYFYTDAWVALAEHRHRHALHAVDEGLSCVRRVSSRRNGQFLRARCLTALGRTEAALCVYEVAASENYQCQGGNGLLAWGDLLARLEKTDEAAHAWKLTLDRDPESESAVLARTRLRRIGREPTTD